MSHVLNILLLLICAVAIFILLRRIRFKGKKSAHTLPENQQAQELYTLRNAKKEDEVQSLSLEERIELSWAFLLNITEQVMSRFSKPDHTKVEQAGRILSKNGTRYQHDVTREARVVHAIIKTRSKEQDSGQSRSL